MAASNELLENNESNNIHCFDDCEYKLYVDLYY